ncbi:heterokaryon incompatibility protein-domain-containing protein [Paraphoma chrysanthemicola]|nr:heterokaryon incompatibility protein-domain-containing protein [Paraphoma chrysanthemicola]
MDDKAETAETALPISEQRPKMFEERNHKKRRLDDGLGEVGLEEKASWMHDYTGPAGSIHAHKSPFLAHDGSIDNKSPRYSIASPLNLPPMLPPSLARRSSYGGSDEAYETPASSIVPASTITRSSSGTYGVINKRRASTVSISPVASPMSIGSRSSSPPRVGSADFARGQITPPSIPFRPDSPALNVENIFRPTSIPQVDRFTLASDSFEYQYHSITSDQIRLLVLLKGSPSEDIHCSLKPIYASELNGSQLGYYALSYAWGERTHLEKIFISDLPAVNHIPSQAPLESIPPKMLHIQTNLHAALKRLRCDDEDVWLWIDAICIDQHNMSEKSHQLPRMRNIYENAYSVCVWLGEPEVDARLNNTCKDPLDFVSVIVNLKFLDHIVREPIAETEEVLASFVAFANLLKRPWFRRRWVIQEVAASKRAFVQVGLKKVNWVDFADAVQLFLANIERIRAMYERSELSRRDPDALGHVESVGAGAIVRATSHVLKRSDEGRIVARLCTIEALVVAFLHYEASDTRDTIYALLSLAKDRDSYLEAQRLFGVPGQQPYEKSTAQVYAEFVHHSIKSSNSLDIICRHWALPSADASGPKVPSWAGVVVDSSFGPSPRPAGRLNGDSLVGKSGNRIYNASGGSIPIMRLYVPQEVPHNAFNIPLLAPKDWRLPVTSVTHNKEHARNQMQPTSQSSIQIMTIKSQQGHDVQIPIDVAAASKIADEKRRRNAGASARFRARRQEKERQASTLIANLEQEIRDLREDVEFYRGQRDAMDKLLNTNSHLSLPRIQSPRHRRHFSGGKSAPRESAYDAYQSDKPDEAISNITSIHRTSSAAHFGETAPQTDSQNSTEVPSILQETSSSQSDLQPVPVSRPRTSIDAIDRFVFGSNITLVAQGFRLCEVIQRSPRVVDGVIAHECLEIAGWNRGLDVNDIPDRLWRTLVADRTDDGSNALSWWRRACMYCLSRSTTQYGDLNTSKLIANRSLPETVLQFLRRVQANVWNRRFFVGRNSHGGSDRMYGLGSRYMQLGDWCCILLGCSVPVILREQDGPFIQFIGECYVDGMMDGQAMDFMKDRNIAMMDFPLR